MTALDKAIEIVGSQTSLASKLGVSPQAVQQWVIKKKPPASRVLQIEKAVNGEVTRSELRPDLYPPDALSA